MIREHKFVVDDAVVEFFAGRTKREREDLLRVFTGLAAKVTFSSGPRMNWPDSATRRYTASN